MKRVIAMLLALVIIVGSINVPVLASSLENVDSIEDPVGLKIVDQYKQLIKEELTVTVSRGFPLKKIAEIKTVNGILNTEKIPIGQPLMLTLVDSSKYEIPEDFLLNLITKTTCENSDFEEVDYVELHNYNAVKVEVKADGNTCLDPIKFNLKEGQNNKGIESKDGALYFDVEKGKEYSLSLIDTDKYEFEDSDFTASKDMFGNHKIYKNETHIESINLKEKNKVESVDVVNQYEQPVLEEVKITVTKMKGYSSELIGEFTVKNGKLEGIEFEPGNYYGLELTGDPVYNDLDDLVFYNNDREFEYDNGETSKNIVLYNHRLKDIEVLFENKKVSETLRFELIDDVGVKALKTSEGKLYINIDKNKNYTLKLVDDSVYEFEDIILTTKTDMFGNIKLLTEDGQEFKRIILNKKPIKENIKLPILCLTCGATPVKDALDFELTSVDGTEKVKSFDGNLEFSMIVSKEYSLKLMSNSSYKMDEFKLVLKADKSIESVEGDKITEIKLTKLLDDPSPCPSTTCEFSDVKIKLADIPVVDNQGNPVKEIITFKLFNGTKQVFIGDVKAVDGKIPAIDVYEKDTYILYSRDSKYIIADKPYELEVNELYFMPNGDGKLPVRNTLSKQYEDGVEKNIENIVVRELSEGEIAKDKVEVTLPVYYGSAKYSGPGSVIFTSEFDKVNASIENGQISVRLLEDVQYSLSFTFEDFAIENFPLTVKDKSERSANSPWGRGKYAYDHSTCRGLDKIQLVDAGKENNNNTTLTCSNGRTTVSGMNFKDLLLMTTAVDKSNFENLKDRNVQIIRVLLINTRRCEVSKMAAGDFAILRDLEPDKELKEVYFLKPSGELEKAEYTRESNKVLVKTNSMSINDLVIEYKSEEQEPEYPDEDVIITFDPTLDGTLNEDKTNDLGEKKVFNVKKGSTWSEVKADGLEVPIAKYKDETRVFDKWEPELPEDTDIIEIAKEYKAVYKENRTVYKTDPKNPETPEDYVLITFDPTLDGTLNEDKTKELGEKKAFNVKKGSTWTEAKENGLEVPAAQYKDKTKTFDKWEPELLKDIDTITEKTEFIAIYKELETVKPVEPEDPVKPIDPQEPVKPQDPVIPSVPTKPTTPSDKTENIERYSGNDRIETAIEVSKRYYGTASTVILVRADKFPDALTASTIAYSYNAPILLTYSNELDERTAAEITRLGANRIIVVGGINSVSTNAYEGASKLVNKIERIDGVDRYETAKEVAKHLIKLEGSTGKAIITTGENFPDALSISPFAAKNHYPILLVRQNEIPQMTKEALSGLNITSSYIVGGNDSVSETIGSELPNVIERIHGQTRYETSLEIAKRCFDNEKHTFIVSGEEFVDSMVIGPVAAKLDCPVITPRPSISTADSIKGYLEESTIDSITIIGGEKAISKAVENELENIFK